MTEHRRDQDMELQARSVITVIVPDGYDSAEAFLNDCGLKEASRSWPMQEVFTKLRELDDLDQFGRYGRTAREVMEILNNVCGL